MNNPLNKQYEAHFKVCLFSLGRGGASIYGKEFDDEIHADLKHTGKMFCAHCNGM